MKNKDATTETDIVAEVRERFKLCQDNDGGRDESLDDLKFAKLGEQWDAAAARQRQIDGRPCLTINKLQAVLHQVTNDNRQNKQDIKVHPVDNGADVETAEVIAGIIKHIEYDSNADVAYDTAVGSAAAIGFGFFRITTEYENPMSFNQDIKIKRIRNPFTVYPDPASQEPDGSDMQFCVITTKVPRSEYAKQHPDATQYAGMDLSATGDGANWFADDWVRLAEYYRIEYKKATIVQLSDGTVADLTSKDPLKPGVEIVMRDGNPMTRETMLKKVMWYKVNGSEVLQKEEIPCPWIPVFPVYGDEVDVDGKVIRSGLIRWAKDPARAYNFFITAATEEYALRQRTPYIAAEGQLEGYEGEWENANTVSYPYLTYRQVTLDGVQAPAPQRQPPIDVPTGALAMLQHASDNIKAVTGIYDASLGARSNETSGIAITQRQRQGDIANLHFSDNLSRTLRHAGRCIVAMFPHYYDTQRVMRILGEDNSAKMVEINKPVPQQQQKPDPKTGAVKTVENDMTVGTYDVVVESGPSYSTLRQEAAAAMTEVAGKWPQLMQFAGDKVIKSMDWPDASGIAERVKKGLGIHDDDEDLDLIQTPNGPLPKEQAGQMIGQLDQTVQAMQQHIDELESGIAKSAMDNASREKIANDNNQTKLDVEELKGMIGLLMAKINPMVAHEAAVVAAADPEHPDAPPQIAQGLEQAPAAVAEQEAASAPTQGKPA